MVIFRYATTKNLARCVLGKQDKTIQNAAIFPLFLSHIVVTNFAVSLLHSDAFYKQTKKLLYNIQEIKGFYTKNSTQTDILQNVLGAFYDEKT